MFSCNWRAALDLKKCGKCLSPFLKSDKNSLQLNSMIAKTLHRQKNRFPARTPHGHFPAIIPQPDTKKAITIIIVLVNVKLVAIQINSGKTVRENERCYIIRPQNPLPLAKPCDIVERNPVLKTAKPGNTAAGKLASFDLGDDCFLIGRIEQVIETFDLEIAESRPLMLVNFEEMYFVINQPVAERPLIMVE